MNESLPAAALATIDRYLHLPLGDKLVQCPYFKNRAGIRAGLRVYLGKGTPSEIIDETSVLAKKYQLRLEEMSEQEIRIFMEKNNIGIDCSGFISQILSSIDASLPRLIARKNFFRSPLRFLVSRYRPIENISVKQLTDINNCTKIDSWHNIKIGDIIRSRGGHHALIITGVKKAKGGAVQEIIYHHSTSYYGNEHGARQGKIICLYPNEGLKDQDWEEKNAEGRNPTAEGFLHEYANNGIFRLNYRFTKS